MYDELDILKEVGSIASCYGSTALSEILGKKIMLSLVSTDIISSEMIPQNVKFDYMGIAVFSKIIVGLEGEVAFILDEKNIFKLVELSYKIKQEEKNMGVLTEMGLSLIKEIGNMIIGSYITSLGLILKRLILSPVPTLLNGSIGDLLNIILSLSDGKAYSCLIEAVFEEPEEKIKGSFYLVLTPRAVKDIREICKKMLDDSRNGEENKG
ncbi:MAG: chemotaxis protein CheC [Candidatus Omnitrophota bacterium]